MNLPLRPANAISVLAFRIASIPQGAIRPPPRAGRRSFDNRVQEARKSPPTIVVSPVPYLSNMFLFPSLFSHSPHLRPLFLLLHSPGCLPGNAANSVREQRSNRYTPQPLYAGDSSRRLLNGAFNVLSTVLSIKGFAKKISADSG